MPSLPRHQILLQEIVGDPICGKCPDLTTTFSLGATSLQQCDCEVPCLNVVKRRQESNAPVTRGLNNDFVSPPAIVVGCHASYNQRCHSLIMQRCDCARVEARFLSDWSLQRRSWQLFNMSSWFLLSWWTRCYSLPSAFNDTFTGLLGFRLHLPGGTLLRFAFTFLPALSTRAVQTRNWERRMCPDLSDERRQRACLH